MHIVIIGSGISGLTAGAYLARDGHHVEIFEQAPQIGGVTATLHQDGFAWDIGPLLLAGFGPSEEIHHILTELNLLNQLTLVHEDRGLSTLDFSFSRPEKYQGLFWRRDQLKRQFPEDATGLDRYYQCYIRMERFIGLSKKIANTKGISKLWLKIKLGLTALLLKPMMTWNATTFLDHYFTNPKIKGLFAGILADFVVTPSEYPGLGIPLVNEETAFDKRIPLEAKKDMYQTKFHYIQNGCEQLVNVLANFITQHGGQIHTHAKVERIVVENQTAKGILLHDGSKILADHVLSTITAAATFKGLISTEYLPASLIEQVDSRKLMESVFMVHLGVDFDPHPYQAEALRYYYRIYDIEAAVRQIREGLYHEGADGFLIYILSYHSPDMAPVGKHAITIYTVAPNFLREGDWNTKKEYYADKLVEYAELYIPGLKQHTQTRIIMSPQDFRDRLAVKWHSFGGTAPVIGEKNLSHRTPIAHLWFAGCQSESTGGIEKSMMGGRQVSQLILKESSNKLN